VEERRRKRLERPSKFGDATEVGGGAGGALFPAAAAVPGGAIPQAAAAAVQAIATTVQPQQTRHARRLYVGNLPPMVTEEMIHRAFRDAIRIALVTPAEQTDGGGGGDDDDPILSVYINHERRFCFLEFKTVEMTTACMELDGLTVVQGQPPVKIKRPNDYNPAAAPPEANRPELDVSRLGIISSTVLDGPNKIFIGGLHYHLTEGQVLELLQAFGAVKAFHLVKNDPDSMNSKGYCFVEYVDPVITRAAIDGLNGMDIGGGKSLTARLAGERAGGTMLQPLPSAAPQQQHHVQLPGQPDPTHTVVSGYDVEALVDAALGRGAMPSAPVYLDPATGSPLTRIVPAGVVAPGAAAVVPGVPPAVAAISNEQLRAALAALPGGGATAPPPAVPQRTATRVLVLLNMVTDDDLTTEEDHAALLEEVRDECAKFGALRSVRIPRAAGGGVEASAVRKVFLEYASAEDAAAAEQELTGRQFGDAVVATEFLPEADFLAGRLR
jgi:splicing factor U2AF subunit